VDILIVRLGLAGKDALMGAQRKSYTPSYRREAAHLVIDTGRTIVEVAAEIGVGEQLLGRWVAIERSRMDDPPAVVDADERAELVRLRREVAELRMDREFLKKVVMPPWAAPGVDVNDEVVTGLVVREDRRAARS
jgi:transposase